MTRLPRPSREQPAQPVLAPSRLPELRSKAPEAVAALERLTASWAHDDPRWDDLITVLEQHKMDTRRNEAANIRKHADSPSVKPHLLEGEWTGLRMAANLLHLEKD